MRLAATSRFRYSLEYEEAGNNANVGVHFRPHRFGERQLFASIRRLEEEGRLPAPYAEKVEGRENLFEIRVRDGEQIRVFYAYARGDDVWLLSGFVKKTQRTPTAEIRKALKIRKELGL